MRRSAMRYCAVQVPRSKISLVFHSKLLNHSRSLSNRRYRIIHRFATGNRVVTKFKANSSVKELYLSSIQRFHTCFPFSINKSHRKSRKIKIWILNNWNEYKGLRIFFIRRYQIIVTIENDSHYFLFQPRLIINKIATNLIKNF